MSAVIEPRRRGRTQLAGGRRLGWSEWGPEDGTIVLYCTGAGASSRLAFAGDAVDALRVRLVGIDRPGLGASDPAPGRTLLDWAEDVRALVSARGLGEPLVVGVSQGAPFALACAAAGIVRGVAVVSGSDELAALGDALVPDVRRLIAQVATDPAGAEAFFSGMKPETFHSMVITMSSALDRAIYSEPTFDRTYRSALDEGFEQGAAGYARDTLLSMSPWPFDVSRITVPVDLWYGAHDTSPVHSPDLGASLAARIPTARRVLVDDAGGALLWTHGEPILASLLERTRR